MDVSHSIAKQPHIGRSTNGKAAKFKIARDYCVIHEEIENDVQTLTIRDPSQDQEKLKVP